MIDAELGFKLYGTTRAEAPSRLLKAGKLTAQLAGGNLRAITYDGTEIVRAISYLVRDRDWGTSEPTLSELIVRETDDSFAVSYIAKYQGADGTVLEMTAAIEGRADGRLSFRGEARSVTGFETNRCGFCILHPIVGLAGMPVSVEHVDGEIEHTRLPDLIDPWQPFKDMRAITHTAVPGVTVECRMEGGTFEMEDQRNWSDASYKTYVRPLALPWPYRIVANEPLSQRVALTITDGHAARKSFENSGVVKLTPGDASGRMPGIGVVITPEEAKASLSVLSQTGILEVQDLLFHFDPTVGHNTDALADFAAIAAHHNGTTTLELAVPCQRALDHELQEISGWMRAANFAPDAIVVCPSIDRQSTPPGSRWPDCPPLEDVYAAAANAFPGIELGGGMLSYFTELNRKRVPAESLAFIYHCTNPIVHAADDVSVMQTLEALPFIAKSVRSIYGDKPYRLGPSTIPMRQNPYGSRTMDNPAGGRIPMANRDPRHNGLFGAAFAVGYVASLLVAGPATVTLSALTGSFGLFADKDEPVLDGGRRPLHHIVASLAGAAGQRWRAVDASRPDRIMAFKTEGESGAALWIVNLSAQTQSVDMTELDLPVYTQLSVLDADSLTQAAQFAPRSVPTGELLTLSPFAVAHIRINAPGSAIARAFNIS